MKHRVIGLKLEGMTEISFIYYKIEMDGNCDDAGDLENYILRYRDVVLLTKYVNFHQR
jgi:hypothetical protein